jgi:hypothetical protein
MIKAMPGRTRQIPLMARSSTRFARSCAALGGLFLWLSGLLPAAAVEPRTVGWIERVKLGTDGIVVAAKLDTGADTSSLHAENIRWVKRADGDWVAFDVVGATGEKARFEHKVVRIARIKRDSAPAQSRPTIVLGVCLGNVYRLTEVNLTDRSRFNYEMLVGRSFLAGRFAVDSARMNTVEPACKEAPVR